MWSYHLILKRIGAISDDFMLQRRKREIQTLTKALDNSVHKSSLTERILLYSVRLFKIYNHKFLTTRDTDEPI